MAAATGHVIVCGLSGLGLRITEQLIASGVAVVVVDDRYAPSRGRQLERWAARLVVESPQTAEACGKLASTPRWRSWPATSPTSPTSRRRW